MGRVEQLEQDILKHLSLYQEGVPEISDLAYDALVRELKFLNPKSEVLFKVGFEPTYGKKVNHDIPMGSLNKVTFYRDSEGNIIGDGLQELNKWEASVVGNPVVWSFKIDGLSAELVYENGKLVLASTRGNGLVGLNITDQIINCENIPNELNNIYDYKHSSKITFRGELYIPKVAFKEMLLDGRVKKVEGSIQNERNVCAGFINNKNPEECKNKNISFIGYRVFVDDVETETLSEGREIALLFNIPFVTLHKEKLTRELIDKASAVREKLPYRTDGIVLTVDNTKARDFFGYNKYNCKGSVAFKFDTDKAWTKLLGIEWNTSRHGRVIPTALLSPVVLCDTEVERATLNNWEYAESFGFRSGDEVLVSKNGDIIPCIINHRHTCDSSESLKAPENCPVCGECLYKDGVDLICMNPKCKAQVAGAISWWLKILDIEEPGKKMVETMVEASVLKSIVDLYTFTVEDAETLPRCSKMLANRYRELIDSRRKLFLPTFLVALGIRGIGDAVWNEICKFYKTLPEVLAVKETDLVKINKVGEINAKKICDYFSKNLDFIQELCKKVEVLPVEDTSKKVLSGKTVCFTGTLSKPRSFFENLVKENGGEIRGVSKTLDILVAGDSAGSKLDKAKTFGITVMTEGSFMKLIVTGDK